MAGEYTADDLAAVRSAIARGERSVQFADRSVIYRDMDELLKAEERILSAISASSVSRSKQTFCVGAKGF